MNIKSDNIQLDSIVETKSGMMTFGTILDRIVGRMAIANAIVNCDHWLNNIQEEKKMPEKYLTKIQQQKLAKAVAACKDFLESVDSDGIL